MYEDNSNSNSDNNSNSDSGGEEKRKRGSESSDYDKVQTSRDEGRIEEKEWRTWGYPAAVVAAVAAALIAVRDMPVVKAQQRRLQRGRRRLQPATATTTATATVQKKKEKEARRRWQRRGWDRRQDQK